MKVIPGYISQNYRKMVSLIESARVEKAKTFLEAAGYPVEQINSIILKLPDQPGELNKISTILSKESINIQKVQVLLRDGNQTLLSLSTDKPKRASKLLEPYLLNHES
jgi:hypothetical protein